MIGAGSIGAATGGNVITLPDIDGTSSFQIQDADQTIVFKVDSLGNYGGRGKVKMPTD